jgi:CBS domain-containing protein
MFPSYREFYETPDAFLDFEELEKEVTRAGERRVEEVMAQRLITATPETPILKIASQMIASGIHRIPVVEGQKLVGIVSRRDIYRAIMREYFGLWEVEEKETKAKPKSSAKKSK